MKLFNRDWKLIARNAYQIPAYLVYFLRCFLLVKHPFDFISSYLRMMPPAKGVVQLRNGMEIYVSDHPHDIVTIFLIFIRKDYGPITPGSTVIDIGANIGAFSLFAANCGASRIYAYEPNSEAFRCLQRNIHANRLESVIEPHRFAVTDSSGQKVRFPKDASAYNSILRGKISKDYEVVKTIDLTRIMKDMDHVDLLKMDCEGAEWDILRAASHAVMDRIQTIRMEYHTGLRNQITSFLQRSGFSLIFLAGTKDAGTMWFERR